MFPDNCPYWVEGLFWVVVLGSGGWGIGLARHMLRVSKVRDRRQQVAK